MRGHECGKTPTEENDRGERGVGKRKLATLEKSPFCGTESHEKVLNQVSESATESYMQRSFKLNISETNQEKWEGGRENSFILFDKYGFSKVHRRDVQQQMRH